MATSPGNELAFWFVACAQVTQGNVLLIFFVSEITQKTVFSRSVRLSIEYAKIVDDFLTLSRQTKQPICADWFRGPSFIRAFLLHILYCQAKISLLKKACKDKDAAINDLSEEIRELRHSIATSTLDDLSKIRTYGYSPENFVKLSSQREQQLQMAKRDPEVCVIIMDNQSVCKIKFDAVVC